LYSLIKIVGVGRSGTSLLHAILASSSKISTMPETGIYRRFFANKMYKKWIKKYGLDRANKYLFFDKKIKRLNLNSNIFDGPYKHHFNKNKCISAYLSIIEHKKKPETIFCDKDPRVIEIADIFLNDLPESIILHIYRDPRAVISSKKSADWSKKNWLITMILKGCIQLACIEFSKKKYANRIIELSYESLLSDQNKTLNSFGDVFGEKFFFNKNDHLKSAKQLISPDEEQWKKNITNKIDVKKIDSWKQKLSPFETSLIESCNKDFMLSKGYVLNTYKHNFLSSIIIFISTHAVKFGVILYLLLKRIRLTFNTLL